MACKKGLHNSLQDCCLLVKLLDTNALVVWMNRISTTMPWSTYRLAENYSDTTNKGKGGGLSTTAFVFEDILEGDIDNIHNCISVW